MQQLLTYDVIPGRCDSIEPGISRFPDAQLRICGLVRSLSSGRALRGPGGTIPE